MIRIPSDARDRNQTETNFICEKKYIDTGNLKNGGRSGIRSDHAISKPCDLQSVWSVISLSIIFTIPTTHPFSERGPSCSTANSLLAQKGDRRGTKSSRLNIILSIQLGVQEKNYSASLKEISREVSD